MTSFEKQIEFRIGELYSSEEIQGSLNVGNAGGVRVSLSPDGVVRRGVVMTATPSARQATENPYHDRIENGILVYTGAGLEGDQSLGGVNRRLPEQLSGNFPLYGFMIVGSRRDRRIGPRRWKFLGLLEYIRHYPDTQIDTRAEIRKVWLFEFLIHNSPSAITIDADLAISDHLLTASRKVNRQTDDEQQVVQTSATEIVQPHDPLIVESVRSSLLEVDPHRFEHLIKDLLLHTGFENVTVTQYSQDGGVDVNAYAGRNMWPVQNMQIQLQAKRWLHTVGRKEIAELRGSLQPHARGAVVTTSHYSRAAMTEANAAGKAPIVLVDGFALASLFLDAKFDLG